MLVTSNISYKYIANFYAFAGNLRSVKMHIACIRLSEKCLSFTDTSFTATHLYINMKPNVSNVVIFILIEQNGPYVTR